MQPTSCPVPRAPCPVARAMIYTPEGESANPRQPGACPVPRGAWPVQRMAAGLGTIAPGIERCVACPRPRQRAGVPYTPGPVPRAARARQKKDCYSRRSPPGTGAHRPPGPRRGGGPYRLDCATFCHFPQKILQNFPTGARCGHPMANGWADCGGDGAGVHGIRPCCTKSGHC